MNLFDVLLALLFNKVALQCAICAACVLAPLYAFVLKPVLRWTRYRVSSAAATQLVTPPLPPADTSEHHTPVRLSSASSRAFLSPTSIGATPLQVTPVFHAAPHARTSGEGSRSRGSGSTRTSVVSTDEASQQPSLEVIGTAIRPAAREPKEEEEYRSPTKRFVSALKRQVQLRGAAMASGQVFIHRPARRLPSQDYLALRLLRRQQQHALYDELNITDASLDALYASPAFQTWYGANREELLRDAQLRESSYKWRSLARATVLLTALMVLPAFSFSTETNAQQWRRSLTSDNKNHNAGTVASAPFAQLLLTRMSYIQNARSVEVVAAQALPFASHMRADVRTFAASVLNMAEWVAVVTAVCCLVTSCFMPRGSRRTASVAFAAFLVVLTESALVPGVAVKLGLGTLLILIVVGTAIRRATE